jgi:hypothetical protein
MAMNPDRWDFVTLRANVLGMMGFPTSGSLAVRALPVVNTCIKQAHKAIYESSTWYPLTLRVEETLIDGETQYEWPASLDPGRVYHVGVRTAASVGTQYVYPMRPGLREFERNAGIPPNSPSNTQPLFYQVENGEITISPAPDTAFWDALIVEGMAAFADLVNDADLSCVDGLIVAQRAEIMSRPRLGLPVDQILVDMHNAYARDIISKNSDGRVFMMNDATGAQMPASPDSVGLTGYTSWRPPAEVVGL